MTIDHAALIERLETDTGPDREIDFMMGSLWPAPRPFSLCTECKPGIIPVYQFTSCIVATGDLLNAMFPDCSWILAKGSQPDEPSFVAEIFGGPKRPVDGDAPLGDAAEANEAVRCLLLAAVQAVSNPGRV
jgi:hypothetical protein